MLPTPQLMSKNIIVSYFYRGNSASSVTGNIADLSTTPGHVANDVNGMLGQTNRSTSNPVINNAASTSVGGVATS